MPALVLPKGHTFASGVAGELVTMTEFPDGFVGTGAPTTSLLKYQADGSDMGIGTGHIPSGSSGMVRDDAGGGTTHWAYTFLVKINAFSASTGICQVRATSGQAAAVNLILSGGNPYINLANAAGVQILASVSLVGSMGGIFKVELEGNVGTTTADGKFRGRITRMSDGVVIYDTGTQTGNFGTGSASHHQTCKTGSTPTVDAIFLNMNYWDGDVWADGGAKYLPLAVDDTIEPDDDPAAATEIIEHTYLTGTAGDTLPALYGQPFGPDAGRVFRELSNGSMGASYELPGAFNSLSIPPTNKISFATYVQFDQIPALDRRALSNFRTPDTANLSLTSLVFETNGRLQLDNGDGTSNIADPIPGTEVTPGTVYRMAMKFDLSKPAGSQRAGFRLQSADGTSTIFEFYRADLDLDASTINGYRRGMMSGSESYMHKYDGEHFRTGVFAWLDPIEDAPWAGEDQVVEPLTTVTLLGRGPGTWSQTSGPAVVLGGAGSTRTFESGISLADIVRTFAYGGDPVTVTTLQSTEWLWDHTALEWVPHVGHLLKT